MFRIRGGVVPTELLNGVGLGFKWPPEINLEASATKKKRKAKAKPKE